MLPESWLVKHDGTPEFQKVIKFLNKERNVNYKGTEVGDYYGVQKGTTRYTHSLSTRLDMNSTILSVSQFLEAIGEGQNSQTIKREHLKEIYDVVCTGYKAKIMEKCATQPFGDITLSNEEVNLGISQADGSQLTVILKYLKAGIDLNPIKRDDSLEDVVSNFSQSIFGDMVSFQVLRAECPGNRPELRKRAFYVDRRYEVEIDKTPSGGTFIALKTK